MRLFRLLIQSLILSTSTALLISCSFLSPVKVDPESNYMLNAVPNDIKMHSQRPVTLMVAMPETMPAYNTTQMAYTIKPYQVAYFTRNRWAETPAQMLQPLIVQSLQNTGHFQAIVTPPFIGTYHYILNSQILQLQQNFTVKPAALQLIIRMQLVNMITGKVVATKHFSIREPIRQKTPYGGVLAANRASERFLNQMVDFCLQHT